jgi:hypothetical protein
VWFSAASMVTTIVHEVTHACTAFAFGVRSTLFNYWADLDLTPAQAASNLPALIRIAGPTICLVLGVLSWLVLKRSRGTAGEIPLIYFAVFGIGTFFGNLMSTAFVGDFSAAAVALNLSTTARYLSSVVGALSLAAIHVWAGRELVQTVPAQVGRLAGMLGVIVLPVVVGTTVVILVNQPMPAASVSARVAEASFWVFAAAGALTTGRRSANGAGNLRLRLTDVAVMLFAILVVRLMVRGIPLVP